MCVNRVRMLVAGHIWKTRFATDSEHVVEIGHNMEQSLRRKTGTIENSYRSPKKATDSVVGDNFEDCNLRIVIPGRVILPEISGMQNQPLDGSHAYSESKHSFQSLAAQETKRSGSQQSRIESHFAGNQI